MSIMMSKFDIIIDIWRSLDLDFGYDVILGHFSDTRVRPVLYVMNGYDKIFGSGFPDFFSGFGDI